MTPPERPSGEPIVEAIRGALIWAACFAFAVTIFFCLTKWLRFVPATRPIGIGVVTVHGLSKLRDYLAALLFFLVVPAGTILLRNAALYDLTRLRRMLRRDGSRGDLHEVLAAALYVWPFLLAPFFWLTTRKEGWALLLPPLLSQLGSRAAILLDTNPRVRALFTSEVRPAHTLLLTEASAWLLFRYIAAGSRIAHIPTLFLESIFVAFFLLLFWSGAMLIAFIGEQVTGSSPALLIRQVALAAVPILFLPPLSLSGVDLNLAALTAIGLTALLAFILVLHPVPFNTRVRSWLVLLAIPVLLYTFSHASSSAQSQWIDLFHRGESLGPASDYLRGKTPYTDVFVLHGLLDDGFLDAGLMRIFGRDLAVTTMRHVILGSLAMPALWFLAMVVFDSIPLALLSVLSGIVTFVDNERVLFEIVVAALLIYGLRRGSRLSIALAGLVCSLALFFSLEIGLYSMAGCAGMLLLHFWTTRRRIDMPSPPPVSSAALALILVLGIVAGAAPFLAYLAMRGALGEFFKTSFVTIPAIIDSIWSLPFPDLAAPFRNDLNLRSLSDFLLTDRFRFLLNPIVISVALTYLLFRILRNRFDDLDRSLAALSLFALVTQRSALGRSDFPHQYFSAFLIGPLVVLLLTITVRNARRLWTEGGAGGRITLLVAITLAIPALATILWVPDLINSRLDDIAQYRRRLSDGLRQDLRAAELFDRVEKVSLEIQKFVPAGKPIFDFSNQPALYFFADRPNPTRFYQVPILSPRRLELETIQSLFDSQPEVVLMRSPEGYDSFDGIDNSLRAPALANYLRDRYAFFSSVRGIEIWRKKDDRTPLDLPFYNRQMRLPSPAESFGSSSQQAVIPSVANFHGSTAFWNSDLTVYNPSHDPMPLRMRYLAGKSAIERTVSIEPQRARIWRDVVKSLFESGETFGPIWLEYRSDRRPVIRVRTYDSLRPTGSTLVPPLDMSDAARANEELRALTIVGLPQDESRRVDVGVIAVGNQAAKFWISARDVRGSSGPQMLGSVSEGQLFWFGDASQWLGTLGPESVIQIEVVSGSAIAFASIVDRISGDSELITATPSPIRNRP